MSAMSSVWAAAARATDSAAHRDAAFHLAGANRAVFRSVQTAPPAWTRAWVVGRGSARSEEVRPHSSRTFLSSVASSLCKSRTLRTAWGGLLWRSFAAMRPSAGEGKEATPQRTLPGQGDFDTGDAPNPSRLPEISGGGRPALWHPPLDLAHSFTPKTDGNPDFAGFCPLLTSHSPLKLLPDFRSLLNRGTLKS